MWELFWNQDIKFIFTHNCDVDAIDPVPAGYLISCCLFWVLATVPGADGEINGGHPQSARISCANCPILGIQRVELTHTNNVLGWVFKKVEQAGGSGGC